MNEIKQFLLFNETFGGKSGNEYTVYVQIKSNCLEITIIAEQLGWGKYSMEMMRRIQYSFDEANTKKFLELLAVNIDNIKEILYENFYGENFTSKIELFCKNNNINFEYSNR